VGEGIGLGEGVWLGDGDGPGGVGGDVGLSVGFERVGEGDGLGGNSIGPWPVDGRYGSAPANVAVYPLRRTERPVESGDALVHDALPPASVTAVQIGVPSEAVKVMVWPSTGAPLLVSVAPTGERFSAVDTVAPSAVSVVAAGGILPSVTTRVQSPGCDTVIPTVIELPLTV
jgi:hypothetical protein